ncbi:TonB-dependent receptor [Vibrio casei]|uniref:Ferric aerobactin receptor n=1 Tax=Vibrio casei TaxID=673372 RepID=A0A368LGX0_9VIBR|nr:TonB-dependent receptor [Vibrio casei]RCS69948.1 TonB-dependent receptor [Vibrio casei]SJN28937.1 Aerobactin siderophore receptor IutA [Vibrio casei]
MEISSLKGLKLKPLTVALTLSGITSFSVNANAEEKPSSMDTVVVVASTAPKSISDIPGTVWYVDSERIEQEARAGKNLGDILAATIPSLDIGSQGRTNNAQNLRGRSALIMIDGVSLNSSRSISRQFDSIDPFNIERIEVLSGATSVYGAGATGGVINIVTKKAKSGDGIQAETYLGAGSGFNNSDDYDGKIAQSISGGNDKARGRISAVYHETGAKYDGNGERIIHDITQGSLQYNEVLDLMASGEVNLTDTQTISILAQYYDSQQDSPYGVDFGKNFSGLRDPSQVDPRAKGYESDQQGGTERYMLNMNYLNTDFLNQQLMIQASYRKENMSFIPFIYGTYMAASEQDTEVVSLRMALLKDFGRFNLTYGIDGYIDTLESSQTIFDPATSYATGGLVNRSYATIGRYPGTEVASIAGFVQGEFNITDDWTVQGGYRYQYINNTVDDYVGSDQQAQIALGQYQSADSIDGGSTDYNVGLFNLGTLYRINNTNQVWANFSQGFDLADPAKYYGYGNYQDSNADGHLELIDSINVADSQLEGMKTNSFEVGMRNQIGELSIQTAAYISLSDKVISYNKKNLSVTVADSDKRVYGLETELNYWFTTNLQVGASGHVVRTEEKDSNGNWVKSAVTTASASKASTWVGWYDDQYGLRLQSNTMFDLSDDFNSELNGYTTVDFTSSIQLPVGSLALGIQNLLDEDYTTVWGQRAQLYYGGSAPAAIFDYKGQGRTYMLSYQVKY